MSSNNIIQSTDTLILIFILFFVTYTGCSNHQKVMRKLTELDVKIRLLEIKKHIPSERS